MDVVFYRCNHCGNIAIKPFDAGVDLVCCGEKMERLVADSQEAATEKHIPAVTRDGNKLHVNIGEVDHPMTPEHYIQFICLVTDDDYTIHQLDPADAPACDFVLRDGQMPVKVYAYCNIHGLWVLDMAN